jgi:hypothetical protein
MVLALSLAEVNQALAEGRERLNDLLFQKLPGSRRMLFETLDRPALRPLPAERYELGELSANLHDLTR